MSDRLIITVKVRKRDNGQQFARGMQRRLNLVKDEVKAAADKAAISATHGSRTKFRRMRKNDVPPRPGRRQRGMAAGLKWVSRKDSVEFDMKDANRRFPYWLVQELGTGPDSRATLFRGSTPNPKGRPKKGAEYVKFVKSQVGRRLRVSLVFGTGAGGSYVRPGKGHGQNLYLASTLSGVRFTGSGQRGSKRPRASIILGKEIPAQAMVQTGAKKGMARFGPAAQNAGYTNFGGYPYVQH